MSEVRSQLTRAASHFCNCFLSSGLFTSGELRRQGFSFLREKSGSGFNGSVAEGNFYGGTDITLAQTDGRLLRWTTRMLYESGDNWRHFAAYAYVLASPKVEEMLIPLYTVAPDDSSETQSEEDILAVDWLAFCDEMTTISEKCLADMEFIFRHGLTGKLYEISLQYPDSSQLNPFRSLQYDAEENHP